MRIQIVPDLHLEFGNPIPELAPGTDALVDHRTGVAASVPKRWAWRPSSTCSPGTEVDWKHGGTGAGLWVNGWQNYG